MNVSKIWSGLNSRVSFHTYESRNNIPATSGVYSWFLPLWLFKDNLEEYIKYVHAIRNYDRSFGGPPENDSSITFNWERIDLQVSKSYRPRMGDSESLVDKWTEILDSEKAKSMLEQRLLQATLFTPPLYVGEGEDLMRRYLDHVRGRTGFSNSFREHTVRLGKEIRLESLLFVCVADELDLNYGDTDAHSLRWVSEQILMKICTPPFSKR